MSIESKILTEELNIKDLSLDRPENKSALVFDVKKELNASDKQAILAGVEELDTGWNPQRMKTVSSLRASLKILYGDQPLPELKAYPQKEQFREFERQAGNFNTSATQEQARNVLDLAENIIIQFPEETRRVKNRLKLFLTRFHDELRF